MAADRSPVVSRIHSAAMQLFAEKGEPQVSVSELAQAAGIARGTLYNHIPAPEALFKTVATQLADEMHARITASFASTTEPAQRLANGMRYFIRRAHEEPHWGRFFCRFGLNDEALRGMWSGPTTRDVLEGVARRQYRFRAEQLPSVLALIAGTTITSMFLVLEGHRTWRDAGADAVELVLRALGLDADVARRYALSPLPSLPAQA